MKVIKTLACQSNRNILKVDPIVVIYRSNKINVYEKSNVAQMMSQSNTEATQIPYNNTICFRCCCEKYFRQHLNRTICRTYGTIS